MERENLQAIRDFQPELLRELRPIRADMSAGPAKKGPPTLLVGGVPVHSKYDPQREALKLVEGAPAQLHLHFGFGLGYWAEADSTLDQGQILIFEPDPAMVTAALGLRDLTSLFSSGRVRLFCEFSRFEAALETLFRGDLAIKMLISPYHRESFPHELKHFEQLPVRLRFAWELMLRSLHLRGPLLTAAALEAFPLSRRCPGVDRLENALAGRPAVIVAAGPSLQRNLADLAPYAEACAVFSLARTASLLERVGIRPHFLVHNECSSFYSLIESCHNLDQTLFLLADHAEPAFFRRAVTRTLTFTTPANFGSSWLHELFPWHQSPILESGGSVANEAFSLALLAGCNPIVLLGQDLGWAGPHFYSDSESNRDPHYSEQAIRQVGAYFGGQIQTYTSYLSYILWFARRAQTLAKTEPGRILINATEGGAEIPGFRKLSLRETAQRYFRGSIPDVSELATPAPERVQSGSALRTVFAGCRAEIEPLKRLVQKGERHCRAQLELLGSAAVDGRRLQRGSQQLDEIREQYAARMASFSVLGGFMQKQLWEIERRFAGEIGQIAETSAQEPPRPSDAEELIREMKGDVEKIRLTLAATGEAIARFEPLLEELCRTSAL